MTIYQCSCGAVCDSATTHTCSLQTFNVAPTPPPAPAPVDVEAVVRRLTSAVRDIGPARLSVEEAIRAAVQAGLAVNSTEVERLRARVAELEAQAASRPADTGPR